MPTTGEETPTSNLIGTVPLVQSSSDSQPLFAQQSPPPNAPVAGSIPALAASYTSAPETGPKGSPLFYSFVNDDRARRVVGAASEAYAVLKALRSEQQQHTSDTSNSTGNTRLPSSSNGGSVPRPVTLSPDGPDDSDMHAGGGDGSSVFPALFRATTREFQGVLALDPTTIDHAQCVALLKHVLVALREGVAPTAYPGASVTGAPGGHHHGSHHYHHAHSHYPGGHHHQSLVLPHGHHRTLRREASADSLQALSPSATPLPPNNAIAQSPFLQAMAAGYGSFRRVQFAAGSPGGMHDAASPAFAATPVGEDFQAAPDVQEFVRLIREPSENPQMYDIDEDDDVVGTTINGFMLVGDLGKGSFGRVMLACHAETDEVVAIKIVHKSLLNRERRAAMMPTSSLTNADGDGPAVNRVPPTQIGIRREIAVMKRLQHRHLVSLKAVIDDPHADRLYLVMQYVPHGPFLPKKKEFDLHRCEPIPEPKARRYARQLISALRYLHSNNVVHRDVKPENILRGDDDQLYLADFGVSEIVDDLEVSRRVTGTHGTPAFWAPEMFDEGTSEIDGVKQDEWALSVTIYLMLVGRLPFDGFSLNQLGQSARFDPLLIPDHLSHQARTYLHQALDRDPNSRLNLDKMRRHPFITGPRQSRVRNKLQDRIRVAAEMPSTAAASRSGAPAAAATVTTLSIPIVTAPPVVVASGSNMTPRMGLMSTTTPGASARGNSTSRTPPAASVGFAPSASSPVTAAAAAMGSSGGNVGREHVAHPKSVPLPSIALAARTPSSGGAADAFAYSAEGPQPPPYQLGSGGATQAPRASPHHGPLPQPQTTSHQQQQRLPPLQRGAEGAQPQHQPHQQPPSRIVHVEMDDVTSAIEPATIVRGPSLHAQRGEVGAAIARMQGDRHASLRQPVPMPAVEHLPPPHPTTPFSTISRAESASFSPPTSPANKAIAPPALAVVTSSPPLPEEAMDPDSPTREGSPAGIHPIVGGSMHLGRTFNRLTALVAQHGPFTPNHARAAARAALGNQEFSLTSPVRGAIRAAGLASGGDGATRPAAAGAGTSHLRPGMFDEYDEELSDDSLSDFEFTADQSAAPTDNSGGNGSSSGAFESAEALLGSPEGMRAVRSDKGRPTASGAQPLAGAVPAQQQQQRRSAPQQHHHQRRRSTDRTAVASGAETTYDAEKKAMGTVTNTATNNSSTTNNNTNNNATTAALPDTYVSHAGNIRRVSTHSASSPMTAGGSSSPIPGSGRAGGGRATTEVAHFNATIAGTNSGGATHNNSHAPSAAGPPSSLQRTGSYSVTHALRSLGFAAGRASDVHLPETQKRSPTEAPYALDGPKPSARRSGWA